MSAPNRNRGAKKLAATDARVHFGELVDNVAGGDTVAEVERADGFMVVVAPVEGQARIDREFDAKKWLAELDRIHEQIRAWRATHPIVESTVDILRELRDDR